MNTVYVKLTDIHPYSKNAKTHDKKQIKNISKSIEQYGWTQPIVLDRKNEIVIGHGRFFAAQLLKLKEAPCVYVDGLSDEQVKALRIADNKLNESDWDIKLLEEELEGLDFGDIELDFDLGGETNSVREDDYNPEPPAEPKVVVGDLFRLGRHRLLCGDSTMLTDVQKLMGEETADMLLTDPPYNVALGANGYYKIAGTDRAASGEGGVFLLNDDMPDDEFLQFLTDAFTNASMVMKKGAAFHIWHADSERVTFENAAINAGMAVRQCLIWIKNSFTLGRQDFQWQHEPCLYGEIKLPYPETEEYEVGDEHETAIYGWKDGSAHYWFKNRKQSTALFFDKPKVSKEHPTMKPIQLFDYEIKCNTLVDENVLDLFAGSGTTIMACEQNGRRAFCMEFDPKYAEVIVDRLESFTGEHAMLINTDGTETAWSEVVRNGKTE